MNKQMEDIQHKIKLMLKDKSKVIIAIDGNAGAGKTTLANFLKQTLKAQVIHMDNFFLPLELRTKSRYQEIGGNIHYERFVAEVTQNIKSNIDFEYRVFSCKRCDYVSTEKINNSGIIIIEGVYSMNPKLNMDYDLKLFIEIDEIEQANRIIKRNGMDMYNNFKKVWIPLENKYFEYFKIKENSDKIIKI